MACFSRRSKAKQRQGVEQRVNKDTWLTADCSERSVIHTKAGAPFTAMFYDTINCIPVHTKS